MEFYQDCERDIDVTSALMVDWPSWVSISSTWFTLESCCGLSGAGVWFMLAGRATEDCRPRLFEMSYAKCTLEKTPRTSNFTRSNVQLLHCTYLYCHGIAPFSLAKYPLDKLQRTFLMDSNALRPRDFYFFGWQGVNFRRVFTSGTADVCEFQHKGSTVVYANSTFVILQSWPDILNHDIRWNTKFRYRIQLQKYFRENKQNGGCLI